MTPEPTPVGPLAAKQPMSPATLAALQASITHWEEMARSGWEKEQPAWQQCALCRMFLHPPLDNFSEKACCGCPVFSKTGLKCCLGTSYRAAFIAWKFDHDHDAFLIAAQAEVAFLKSLLPEEAK